MNNNHLLLTRLVNTLLTHDVRAMGRKFNGFVGSSTAFFLPNKCTMPTLHAEGMAWVIQQQLNMCNRAGNKEGHLLKIEYGIWSAGLGEDDNLSLEMIFHISSSVKGAVVIWMVGGGHSGIHEGRSKVLGDVEYTREKNSSACSLVNDGLIAVKP